MRKNCFNSKCVKFTKFSYKKVQFESEKQNANSLINDIYLLNDFENVENPHSRMTICLNRGKVVNKVHLVQRQMQHIDAITNTITNIINIQIQHVTK